MYKKLKNKKTFIRITIQNNIIYLNKLKNKIFYNLIIMYNKYYSLIKQMI